MHNDLQAELDNLLTLDRKIIELAKRMLNPAYPLDFLIGVALNRSLSLVNGYVTLTRANNFLGASHLIRPNLDNYLRLNGACMVSDPHEFANAVLKGSRVKDIKDKNGIKMTDLHLKTFASKDRPWITNIYDDASGFIHLGSQHVKSSIVYSDKDGGTLQGTISREDRFIPDAWKVEATQVMTKITMTICEFVEDWIEIKFGSNSTEISASIE